MDNIEISIINDLPEEAIITLFYRLLGLSMKEIGELRKCTPRHCYHLWNKAKVRYNNYDRQEELIAALQEVFIQDFKTLPRVRKEP